MSGEYVQLKVQPAAGKFRVLSVVDDPIIVSVGGVNSEWRAAEWLSHTRKFRSVEYPTLWVWVTDSWCRLVRLDKWTSESGWSAVWERD